MVYNSWLLGFVKQANAFGFYHPKDVASLLQIYGILEKHAQLYQKFGLDKSAKFSLPKALSSFLNKFILKTTLPPGNALSSSNIGNAIKNIQSSQQAGGALSKSIDDLLAQFNARAKTRPNATRFSPLVDMLNASQAPRGLLYDQYGRIIPSTSLPTTFKEPANILLPLKGGRTPSKGKQPSLGVTATGSGAGGGAGAASVAGGGAGTPGSTVDVSGGKSPISFPRKGLAGWWDKLPAWKKFLYRGAAGAGTILGGTEFVKDYLADAADDLPSWVPGAVRNIAINERLKQIKRQIQYSDFVDKIRKQERLLFLPPELRALVEAEQERAMYDALLTKDLNLADYVRRRAAIFGAPMFGAGGGKNLWGRNAFNLFNPFSN